MSQIQEDAESFGKLVEHMKQCGWTETCVIGDIYVIRNLDVTDTSYDNWVEAIKAAIEVGSGV